MDAEQAFISMYGQMSRRHRTIFKRELSIIRKAVRGSVTDSAALLKDCRKALATFKNCTWADKLIKRIDSALPAGKQQPQDSISACKWKCERCGAVFAEYVNGCPKCENGADTASVR